MVRDKFSWPISNPYFKLYISVHGGMSIMELDHNYLSFLKDTLSQTMFEPTELLCGKWHCLNVLIIHNCIITTFRKKFCSNWLVWVRNFYHLNVYKIYNYLWSWMLFHVSCIQMPKRITVVWKVYMSKLYNLFVMLYFYW